MRAILKARQGMILVKRIRYVFCFFLSGKVDLLADLALLTKDTDTDGE